MDPEELEEVARQRAAATEAIVGSEAAKKLIVAGPGTGKTFTFRQALEACEGRGLALTFIRNLVADLRGALEDIADVFTFHGFCTHQLHRNPVSGLQADWLYYPPLLDLIEQDFGLLGRGSKKRDIEAALHTLDDSGGVISEVLQLGNYYNAVSHTDLVYRVLRHFEQHKDEIPRYPLIVVDEYQDFSELETNFIGLLGTKSPVLIAGDDDQALYSFKNADARFIRELAEGGEYERFGLPFCSRCTQVVVEAVNDGLRAAVDNGNLAGRLDKPFECFVPDKAADSEAHPRIIHVRCTVERKNARYAGRYIAGQIAAIPEADIRESQEQGYPTVLVIGPNPFRQSAFEVIAEHFPQAEPRESEQPDIDALDGYRYLAKDEGSRLAWRILIHCDGFDNSNDILAAVLAEETQLAGALPDDYRERHLEIAGLLRRFLGDGDDLSEAEVSQLCAAADRSLDELKQALSMADAEEGPEEDASQEDSAEANAATEPSIICTSLIGAKGLSAGYVFIVGFNDAHLPRDPNSITDEEVCSFLVGLSRTRKECHLISCRRLGNELRRASRFREWIAPHLSEVRVDAKYFEP